jgi:hypothetical protein
VSDFVSFGCAPCADLGGGEDLRVDVDWWLVAGAGSVLMHAYHPGVDPYRPRRTLVTVGVPAELIKDPFPGSVA